MIRINPSSINDLVALKNAGIPVTLTSHPGNASLYKLVFWACGIPEHLWDVTCCKADANNWPMHQLRQGEAELLISEVLHKEIIEKTTSENRFVTAYQFTQDGSRLGRHHVRAMQACSPPNIISSCSRLLLSHKETVLDMFDFLARTKKEEVFERFITPEGILRPFSASGIKTATIAESFMGVLEELDHLLFSDEPIRTKGGACYSGIMVPLSTMLAQFWETGRIDRYDISGPDMIHYATRPEHQAKLAEMLQHLRKWNPKLIPPNILVQMFPGTVARVGYVQNHPSEKVLKRKIYALEHFGSLDKERKKSLWEQAKGDGQIWPTQIRPNADKYFSQHDLFCLGEKLMIDDFWRSLPISTIKESLTRADGLLRI